MFTKFPKPELPRPPEGFLDEKQLDAAVRQFLNSGFDDDVRYLNKMK